MRLPHSLLALTLWLTVGCASVMQQYTNAVAAAYDVDGPFLEKVRAAAAAAKASPGDVAAALAYGRAVDEAVLVGALQRGKLTAADVDGAVAALDAVSDDKSQALAVKGNLLLSAGRTDDGVAALEASLADKPNLWATPRLFPALIAQGKRERVVEHCKSVRKALTSDEERVALLTDCTASLGDASWASKEDQQLYAKMRAAAEANAAAEREAYERKRAEERAALDASFSRPGASAPSAPSGGGAGGGASASGPVSVQIRCTCNKTVPVFYGDTPKYGSGTKSTCSSNSVSSKSFSPGDMMWLIDERENGLGSVTVSSSTRNIEVSCTSISAR